LSQNKQMQNEYRNEKSVKLLHMRFRHEHIVQATNKYCDPKIL